MEEFSPTRRINYRLVGYLYAFMYFASDRLVVGASLLGWITAFLIILGLYLWYKTGSVAWFLVVLSFAALLRIAYWLAKRNGFILFVNQEGELASARTRGLVDYQKLDLRASGVFSVANRDEYMFRRPALLWRVPFGDHALMVQRPEGRYLYQFVEAGHMAGIEPGWLVYGSQLNFALEINFQTTWGSVAGETDFNWFAPKESVETKRYKRTLYLGLEDEETRDAVLASLVSSEKDRTEE